MEAISNLRPSVKKTLLGIHARFSSVFLILDSCSDDDDYDDSSVFCVLYKNRVFVSVRVLFKVMIVLTLKKDLASLKTQSKSLFFDCEVEKIKRLCTDSQDGTVNITSNAIMKISTTKISHHSAVAAFLNSFKSLTCSNVSSLATGPVSETDIPIMLEKQIEDIFRSVHAPTEGFIEAKGCLPRATLEESSRAYLSPLGARAALASLMQDQPRNSEVPICHVELVQEDLVDASQRLPRTRSTVGQQ
ncbi:hypothetical protein MKX01_032110 [Papaver californicum]|nr:hypothetical protein MKX01_032110 [Papaver californicum]